ncbi:MAG: glycosyltransferase [Clostridiales bacterium]|nr:glycosyltransferase [Clostridiales bacterium]MBR5057744.1 glycosyltransferase [Clostridiales bacterium]
MENKEKSFVSAVIYVHNASERLEGFLRTIINVMESNFEHSEIICVNDFSDDDSLSVIKTVSNDATTTSITVVNMSYYHGLELAMNAGVDMAIGDYVFEFDNTFIDYDPDMIMKVYRHALEGYDIVSASPDRKEKFSSRLFYRIFDRYADIPCNMSTETFRVISRRVINRVSSMNKSIFYRKALYANCGLKTDNIRYPLVAKNRSRTDKKEKTYRSGLALDSLLLFTKVGYRFSMVMTFLMMCMSLFVVAYAVITYIMANPVAGWTTMILFLSVCFFGLFGILTIIIKYLQLILQLVFRRKQYSFESIEKLTK